MNVTSHFHRKLRDKIEAEMRRLADDLIGGNAEDYPDYRLVSGVYNGLKMALRHAEDVERELGE